MMIHRKVRDGGGTAIKWIMALTPIVVALLAKQEAHETHKDGEITAGAVAQMQLDQDGEATWRAAVNKAVFGKKPDALPILAKRVSRLERPVGRVRVGGVPSDTAASDSPARSPGSLERVGRAVAAPFKAAWGWITGR